MRKFTKKINALRNVGLSILLVGLTLVPILSSTTKKASADSTLPAYNYTKTFDTTNGTAFGLYVSTDSSDNIYVLGNFTGTVVFNPSDPSTSVTTDGNNNMFLTKLNSSGQYLWTKTLTVTSNSDAFPGGLKVDNNGNILVQGSIDGTVSLDGPNGFNETVSSPGIVVTPHFSNLNLPNSPLKPSLGFGSGTVFVAKFDTSGNTLWSNVVDNGTGSVSTIFQVFLISIGNIFTDKNNNLYTTGFFCGTVNFSNSISATSQNCSSYVAEYNSSGVFVRLKYTDTNNYSGTSFGNNVAVDIQGNIYVSGLFGGEVGFNYNGTDPGSDVINYGGNGVAGFITKYSSNGDYQWTKVNIPSSPNSLDFGETVITDSMGNIYSTGTFVGNILFNQTDSKTSSDNGQNESSYITKYNSNGDYQWTKISTNQTGSNIADNIESITTPVFDSNGNMYISGTFSGNVLIDSSVNSSALTSINGGNQYSQYITKYNADGSYGWTLVNSYDYSDPNNSHDAILSLALAVDSNGNLLNTGYYSGSIYFNGLNNKDENNSSNQNFFITSWKLYSPPVLSPITSAKTPATGFAKGNNSNQIILYSSLFVALSLITGGYIVNKRSKN